MERCDGVDLEVMVVVAKKICFRRNGGLHGGEFTHPQQVFQEARTSLHDFRKATSIDVTARSPIREELPIL
jgi:hypothetical protein